MLLNTFNTIQEMKKSGLLQYEFSALGAPQNPDEVENWLHAFQKLRNELSKNDAVIFESTQKE